MFVAIKKWYTDHGTKIIGFGAAVIGSMAFIDESTTHAVANLLGHKWGDYFSHAVLIVTGLTTAWRGFQNSQKKADGPH